MKNNLKYQEKYYEKIMKNIKYQKGYIDRTNLSVMVSVLDVIKICSVLFFYGWRLRGN